jgi:predicted phage baseplate assembly protein
MSLPIPNLDNQIFTDLFEESRALIPRYAPEWTDHNFSDPGITLIDLLAWLSEMQIYRLNRVTDKIGLKYLNLLGIEPRSVIPARAEVTFSMMASDQESVMVPNGTRLTAVEASTGNRISFETDEDLEVADLTLQSVLTYDDSRWVDNTGSNSREGEFYYALGSKPLKDNKLYLGFGAGINLLPREISLSVNVYELDLPEPGGIHQNEKTQVFVSAQLVWEYWNGKKWNIIEPMQNHFMAFSTNERIRFIAPADIQTASLDTALEKNQSPNTDSLYWLRASVETPGYEIPPRINTILVNTVSASQRETIRNVLHNGTGLPFQTIELDGSFVIKDSVKLQVFDDEIGWQDWTEVLDFDKSGHEDLHYQLDLYAGIVRFGDGIRGEVPAEAKENIKLVQYSISQGVEGNIQANTVTIIDHSIAPGLKVDNRRSAFGGKDAESLDEAKIRAKRDLKKRYRAVTSEDYQKLALTTPGLRIARAEVIPMYHPRFSTFDIPGAVTVVVVPAILDESDAQLPIASDGFLRTVFAHLCQKRLLSTNLCVTRPIFIKVTVKTKIGITPSENQEAVIKNVKEALQIFLDPLKGGTDRKGWPIGRDVYKSELYQIIEEVKGVTCIKTLSVPSSDCKNGGETAKIPRIGLVYSGEHIVEIE